MLMSKKPKRTDIIPTTTAGLSIFALNKKTINQVVDHKTTVVYLHISKEKGEIADLENIRYGKHLREGEERRMRRRFNDNGSQCGPILIRRLFHKILDVFRLPLFNIHLPVPVSMQ